MNRQWERLIEGRLSKIVIAIVSVLLISAPAFADGFSFTSGDLVVSVEGNGVEGATSGSYGDNQAGPLSLFEFDETGTTSASYVGSLVLPQIASGSNDPVSGEYGSSSEGTLQLSGNGEFLTIAGYGVNAADFNADPGAYSISSTNTALGQSGSIQGAGYTAVPRVVALIDANGSVNSSTALYGIFNGNNPRSAYTADGINIYVSGQGNSPDNTGGVFYTTVGSTSATSITGNDDGSGLSQDTREVQIYNGTLYVSADSKEGSGHNRDFIGTLGTVGGPAPTTVANSSNGPTQLTGFASSNAGKLTVTAANTNGINAGVEGGSVNLSPENYFFASPSVLYVADSGDPKNNSGTSSLGDGGLQKWVNSSPTGSGTWTLEYTISAGLGLVPNSSASGTSGLYGLTGEVVGGEVYLYATNFTLTDLGQTYLYAVTDPLSAMTLPADESFTELAAAPVDSDFKGVSFAPTAVAAAEPASITLLGLGLAALLFVKRRREAV
jgi:hypothetical protein